jgi:Ribbon-helix-helix domain
MPEVKNDSAGKKQKVIVSVNKETAQRMKTLAKKRITSVSALVEERMEMLFSKYEEEKRTNPVFLD